MFRCVVSLVLLFALCPLASAAPPYSKDFERKIDQYLADSDIPIEGLSWEEKAEKAIVRAYSVIRVYHIIELAQDLGIVGDIEGSITSVCNQEVLDNPAYLTEGEMDESIVATVFLAKGVNVDRRAFKYFKENVWDVSKQGEWRAKLKELESEDRGPLIKNALLATLAGANYIGQGIAEASSISDARKIRFLSRVSERITLVTSGIETSVDRYAESEARVEDSMFEILVRLLEDKFE